MCGICGIYNFDKEKVVDKNLLKWMNNIMAHRGPDDEGYYINENVGFGHRRLSIIDLSPAGHQPMFNEDEIIWVAYG
jgi:asparagine synthase (glutamine-hydrolysing)